MNESEISIDLELARHLIFAIRSLRLNEVKVNHLYKVLTQLYDRRLELNVNDKSNLRKAICHVDHLLYGSAQT